MNLSFYAALHRIPLGVAVTIEFVGPLTVAIASSRRPLDLLWVLLAVAGILALTHAGTSGLSAVGILLALLAGCFWGSYILLNARVGRAFEGGAGLAVAMCVAAAVALPLGVADGGSQLAHAPCAADRLGGRNAVLRDSLLVRGGGAAADRSRSVRSADEPRAGCRGDGRIPGPRSGAGVACPAGNRARGPGFGRGLTGSARSADRGLASDCRTRTLGQARRPAGRAQPPERDLRLVNGKFAGVAGGEADPRGLDSAQEPGAGERVEGVVHRLRRNCADQCATRSVMASAPRPNGKQREIHTTRQGHPVADNQNLRTVGARGTATLEN